MGNGKGKGINGEDRDIKYVVVILVLANYLMMVVADQVLIGGGGGGRDSIISWSSISTKQHRSHGIIDHWIAMTMTITAPAAYRLDHVIATCSCSNNTRRRWRRGGGGGGGGRQCGHHRLVIPMKPTVQYSTESQLRKASAYNSLRDKWITTRCGTITCHGWVLQLVLPTMSSSLIPILLRCQSTSFSADFLFSHFRSSSEWNHRKRSHETLSGTSSTSHCKAADL